MGTSFTGHLQATRKATKCFVAATQHHEWLANGVRMLWAIWAMEHTRLCLVNGEKTLDERLDAIGTTLHHVPLERWTDEAAKLEVTAEVKALADEFTRTAKKVVEPKPQDVLNSAKNYFVAKRIMAAENCQGISLNCLGLVANPAIPCPPCMAWQRLNDEGAWARANATGTRASPSALPLLCRGRASSRTPCRTPSTTRSWAPIARRPPSCTATTSRPCR